MLGRKDYTREELDSAKAAIDKQLAAYKKLAKAVEAGGDPKAEAALEAFEPLFARSLTLELDRFFVHRIRSVSGKDGNPLNEVELLTESLVAGDSTLRGNNVIQLKPENTVLGLDVGDRIDLSAKEFERLYKAFLAELEARFVYSA
jgi:hypothetical protein